MEHFRETLPEIDHLFLIYKQRGPLAEEEQTAYYEKLRLEWTYHSNALEGNSLNLGETAFYLREGLTSEGKPLIDYLEVKNHAEAIEWLFDVVQKKIPITESFFKELNALLHRGITERPALGGQGQKIMRKITPGIYKQMPNHVLTLSGKIHHYVEPLQVPGEMEKLIKYLRHQEGKQHPVELASYIHYEFTRIHPFDDCNGRISRMLLNLILMRAYYPPIVIKIEERRRYLEFLEKADAGDREPFYLFIANHVKLSLTTSNQSP